MDILSEKKVFVLLPDGVGLRNFIYTDFLEYGNALIWTPLSYLSQEKHTVKLPPFSMKKLTDIYKNALIKATIYNYAKTMSDDAYLSYIISPKKSSLKVALKSFLVETLAKYYSSDKLLDLRKLYLASVKRSDYYEQCKKQLEDEQPDFVFCTNQRMLNAAAPVLAAQALGIPTGTFIFSWDNLPKGNMIVPAEHLFVWSDYMKEEAKRYYPYVDEEKIHVVGTPQFIPYTDRSLYESREAFCLRYGLDPEAKIICFSGDDVTTSPHDPMYLADVAEAVRELNARGEGKYQILFRRCPVDLSGRYDAVLKRYEDVIRDVPPLWERPKGAATWNAVIPTKEDVKLLVNTVLHSETAVNVGSTIAHDFACLGKTSCYLNYNSKVDKNWDIHKIYEFIHFRSMEGLDPVYWIDDSKTIAETLLAAINDRNRKLPDAKRWLKRIAKMPLSDANKHIWKAIDSLAGRKECI